MIHLLAVIAQAPPTTPGATPQQPGAMSFLPIAIMMGVVVFIFMSSSSQRKREKRERETLLSRLSKNDRVLTIGGIIGTIVLVKDDEVVLKVDESTNTKMTFLKSAVQRILSDEGAGSAAR